MTMTRFNTRIGAGALVGLGVVYLVVALVTGHSAASEPPPDLSATEAGLDVWRALAFVVDSRAPVVDVRPADHYHLYHAPRSRSLPGAGARRVSEEGRKLLLIADSDAKGAQLCGELSRRGITAHFLQGGIRSFYLTLELPVSLFNDTPPPPHYSSAMEKVRRWLESGRDDPKVRRAIERLATTSYLPSLGRPARKPAKKRKKISGGCG
jgi:hypothetical protein